MPVVLQSTMALMECSSLDITAMMGAPQRGKTLVGGIVSRMFLVLLCFSLLAAIVFLLYLPGMIIM